VPFVVAICGSDGRRFWFLGSLVGAEATSYLDPAGGSTDAAGLTADTDGVMEDQAAPERAESPKQRKAKTGANLRKSLAWNSAFFTSEGSPWFCFIPVKIQGSNVSFVELSRLVTGFTRSS
jgi:hypothetical protein